jgi:hypothetical protein
VPDHGQAGRARDQVQVWRETYERESSDLPGLQADLGGAIARQIELLLSPRRAFTITPRQTQDPEAYDLYLRGRYYYNQMFWWIRNGIRSATTSDFTRFFEPPALPGEM